MEFTEYPGVSFLSRPISLLHYRSTHTSGTPGHRPDTAHLERRSAFGWGVLVSSGLNMVRTKADSVPGAYRKVVASRAPRKVLGSSTSATNSKSPSSRKAENKYAGGNPVCVRPTPKWQKGIGEFFRLSSKDSEKENRILEEAGSSGLGKAKRKARPLQPDHTDDENE